MYKPNFYKYQDSWGGTAEGQAPAGGYGGYTTGSNENTGSGGDNWSQYNPGEVGLSNMWNNYTTGSDDNFGADKGNWQQMEPTPEPSTNEAPWHDKVGTWMKKYLPRIATGYATMQGGPLMGALVGTLGHTLFGDPGKTTAQRAGEGVFGSIRDGMAGTMQRETGLPASIFSGAVNRAAQTPFNGTSAPVNGAGQPSMESDPYSGGLGNILRSGSNYYNTIQAMQDLNSQRQGLTSLYDQNGAYAQNLRNQLLARGSASGTRGQTSSSEVALQAELAKLAAQSMPQLSQIDANRQSIRTNRNAQTYNILNDIFGN